jgi:hypothetical protein
MKDPGTYDSLLALKLIGSGFLSFKQVAQLLGERENPTLIILCGSWIKQDGAIPKINLSPLER